VTEAYAPERTPTPYVGGETFVTSVDGTRLYVRSRPGPSSRPSKVTAVLCDGIACDGFIWKYLWADLAEVMPVVHWHYRGHGRSGVPQDPARIGVEALAEDLAEVRRALGLGPVVLFGHSMGCQVALEELRGHGVEVRGLVLICGSSGRITHTFKGTQVMAQYLPGLIAKVESFPGLFRALWGHVPAELAAKAARLLGEVDGKTIQIEDLIPYMKHMVDIDLGMFLRMLRLAGEHSAADLLPSIQVPALVVAGGNDSFTPPVHAQSMAEALPRSELLLVPTATHVVPLERPDLVRMRVLRFLQDTVGLG
jgi:pimeloyl-ACP methyl ester carboxylesterase